MRRRLIAAALVAAIAVAAPAGASGYVRPLGPSPEPVVVADGRLAYEPGATPFGIVGDQRLVHPAAVVERIGFHESNHEGARDITIAHWASGPLVLSSRGRLAGPRSAADIVVQPDIPIVSPVTGTVLRAGTYILYCHHSDDFVVIRPDRHAELEVKLLHIDGVRVAPGDRVVAGETVLAPRATVLPFTSQVDRHTATPSWPHVHLEVIDPTIPNVPNGGSGGC